MAAPLFTVNAHRHDPYRTFKFQVLIDGKVVAGLRKMGALKKKTEPVKWRASNDPSHERVMPGGTSYEPVALEQGLTHNLLFVTGGMSMGAYDFVPRTLLELGVDGIVHSAQAAHCFAFTSGVGMSVARIGRRSWR